jgi:hypothetical protein
MNKISILIVSMIMFSCELQPREQLANESSENSYPEELSKIFKSHGGIEKWAKQRALTFTKNDEETYFTALWERFARVENAERTIGFDGEQVWVSPDTIPVGNARFYHNLYFYFYAMPFVLGDPGINYEELPTLTILNKEYKGIKVTYADGIGDSPKDNYILWYDPMTYQMEWLMYTVTFKSGETSDNYRLIHYSEWTEIAGLKLPTKLEWHTYQNDSVGDVRSSATFSEIKLSEEPLDFALFTMPDDAQIAPFE